MDNRPEPRSVGLEPRRFARWAIFAAIAVVGIGATAFIADTVRREERRFVQAEFESRAHERAQAIERELYRVIEHVALIATVHRAYGEVDRREFSTIATAVLGDHVTIQGLGFNPVVTHEQREAHEAAARRDGFPEYAITELAADGRLVPAAERDYYVVAAHLEPLAGNEVALGYDTASEPVRHAAIVRARDTGQATMTGPLRLVQEQADSQGALMFVPAYDVAQPATIAERRARFRGVAVGVVRFVDIVEEALRDLQPAGIDVVLIDDTAPGPERLLYSHASRLSVAGEQHSVTNPDSSSFTSNIVGRNLRVDAAPTSVWAGRDVWTPLAILVVGIGFTLLLVGYLTWQSAVNLRLRGTMAERERAEERQSGFGRMLDESHDEIYVFDATTLRFVHVNLGGRTNLGYSMDELRALTPLDLKPEMTPSSFEQLLEPLRNGSRNKVVFRAIHERKDGTIYDIEVHLQLSAFDGASAFVAMILDVTERNRIEERLRQSQRLEALGTLAGGIAHDFNNLLTAIMGNAELGLLNVPAGSPVQENLSEIDRAAERARDVVRRILAFSRRNPLAPRPIELREIVTETLSLMRASLPATIEISRQPLPSCPVLGDPTQLHQLLMNLCANAGHAMREGGGVLTVNLDEVELRSTDANRPGVLPPGHYARIRVRDTGRGIPPEIVEQIFDPFFTTKQHGEGSGMGLAMAHGVVAGHGGTVTVTSEVGRGTTFEVLLPRAEAGEAADVETATPLAGGSETIMLIDDEPAVLDVMTQTLQSAGYEVESFIDVEQALARFCEHPERFNLVVTDHTMPKMTGTELAQRVRDLAPGLPLILVSGYGELIDKDEVREAGVTAVVAKPPRMSEFQGLVRELLDTASRSHGQPPPTASQ